jgi:DNA primase
MSTSIINVFKGYEMAKSIEFDIFLAWAKEHFDDIKVTDQRIKVNSVFCEHLGGDTKHHLWCRPYTGHYHCYKSGKRGTLYDLVMHIEKCAYSQAIDILGGDQSLRYLEAKVESFLAGDQVSTQPAKPKLHLPPLTFPIQDLEQPYRSKVESYLKSRKIPIHGLHYCTNDQDFYGRIVIPYYDSDGELIYFNARALNPKVKLRYRGPKAGTGFRKEEVVWMSFFPKKGSKIYLTEGEFDAMTLNLLGFHGCATGGKDVSLKQIEMIRQYEICLAFDTDPSGREAFIDLGWTLYECGVKKVTFIRPPNPYKDWNEMLAGNKDKGKPALDERIIQAYIAKNEKPFNEFTASLLNA